jgi:hypothetical protein
MTETAARPQHANGHAPAASPGALEPPVVTAVRFTNLIEIIAHLADRVSHLEARVDESGIPYRPDLLPGPDSFRNTCCVDCGVMP